MKRWLIALIACWAAASAGAQQGTLLLSELLFQPRSGEAEYVELYNAGDHALDLSNYHMARVLHDSLTTRYALPSYELAPHAYVALTGDVASVAANYTVRNLSALLECRLPPFPNDGGSAVLCTADSGVIDWLDYSPSMHSRLLRDRAGVSLERRSFERPTNEPSNWFSAASTAGYGTPGYENSQSTEYLAEETCFAFSADRLSPDGDGYQDELTIDYRLDNGDLAARAEVYDAHGRQVCRLLNGDLLGTHGTIAWNGTGEGNRRLPQGQYIVMITLYDRGGTQQTLRRTIAVIYK